VVLAGKRMAEVDDDVQVIGDTLSFRRPPPAGPVYVLLRQRPAAGYWESHRARGVARVTGWATSVARADQALARVLSPVLQDSADLPLCQATHESTMVVVRLREAEMSVAGFGRDRLAAGGACAWASLDLRGVLDVRVGLTRRLDDGAYPPPGVSPDNRRVRGLPVPAIEGVGQTTAAQLADAGIHTVGQLADMSLPELTAASHLSPAIAAALGTKARTVLDLSAPSILPATVLDLTIEAALALSFAELRALWPARAAGLGTFYGALERQRIVLDDLQLAQLRLRDYAPRAEL
jgi:hypothetical protein